MSFVGGTLSLVTSLKIAACFIASTKSYLMSLTWSNVTEIFCAQHDQRIVGRSSQQSGVLPCLKMPDSENLRGRKVSPLTS